MSERDVAHIVIPIDVWEDKNLTMFETVLLAEINSLDRGEGCWKSNKELAKRMRCSLVHLEARISSLKKRKYLKTIKKEKHRRYLRTCFSRHLVNHEPIRDKGFKPCETRVENNTTYYYENTIRCRTGVRPCIFVDSGLGRKNSPRAQKITNLFCELLERERLHQARSDLPKGSSSQAKKKRASTIRKWDAIADELIDAGHGHKTIRQVLRWYFDNHRKTHLGSYYAMTTFGENYGKIEKMMRRSMNGHGEDHEEEEYNPTIRVEYV